MDQRRESTISVVAYAPRFTIRRLRNVIVVLLAVGLGVTFPQAAPVVESMTLVIVTFLLYTSFRGTSIDLAEVPSFLPPILSVLTITYVAIPIAGIAAARHLLSGDALLGVAVMLSAPATAGSAIVWTRNSRGNDDLSGLTSVTTIVLAPLLTPFVLARLMDRRVDLPVAEFELNLFLIIAASVILVAILPRRHVSDRTIDVGSELSIVLLIYAAVGTAGLSRLSWTVVAETGLVVVTVFAVGFGAAFVAATISGRQREDYLAIFFSGTLKNLGIALFIVLSFVGDLPAATVIVYYVCQQLLSALLVDGLVFRLGSLR